MKTIAKICGTYVFLLSIFVCTTIVIFMGGCSWHQQINQPSIEITKIPHADEGGTQKLESIAGTAKGSQTGQKIVLFARSGQWWVQPQIDHILTDIAEDGTWHNETHLGDQYAALLVEPGYRPPSTTDQLPTVGGPIIAVTQVEGVSPIDNTGKETKIIQFSGYEWKVQTAPSVRSGAMSEFDPANAWIDDKGFLHLKISRRSDNIWTCAGVCLKRSLGYGIYRFRVHDQAQLDPAAVLSFDTWDDLEAGQNHRQMDFEITRWGDLSNKNLQYVIQPFNVAENVARYQVPNGVLTHSLYWEAGRAYFKTFRGLGNDPKAIPIAEHLFTSGVPAAGGEKILINFYAFHYGKAQMQHESEVVIEKFEFLP